MPYTLFVAIALSATAANAQSGSRSAADAANAFSLDLPAPVPAQPVDAAKDAASDATPSASLPPIHASFTLDTPIAQLVLDPRAKAVLDRDLPGLSDDPNLPKFSNMSLRQFQPMTGGQLTNDLLAKTTADLAALGGSPAVAPPLVAAPTRDRRMDSGR